MKRIQRPVGNRRLATALAGLAALAIATAPAQGQTGKEAARLDTAIARGELRQAGLLLRFNPATDLLGSGGGSGFEVGISQELELFNHQGARRAAGRAGLNHRLADVAGRPLQAGEISRLDYNLATVELGRSRAGLSSPTGARIGERRARAASRAAGGCSDRPDRGQPDERSEFVVIASGLGMLPG